MARAAKRTFDEIFLHRLEAMSAKAPNGRVTGRALEGALGWTVEGRFADIRKQLIGQGKVRSLPGGAGGVLELVQVAPPAAVAPLRAFVSYCHSDKTLKTELLKHLEPLRRNGIVDHWHDGDITAGKEWQTEIWNQLRSAEIIILLVTIDFINSEYCYDKELAAAVERHKAGEARIIPIIGRNCFWQDLPFSQIQAVLNGKPIAAFPDRDDALTQVVKEIKAAAEEHRESRGRAAA